MIYKAKPNTWFDENSEAELIEDYRADKLNPLNCGLFCGYRNGKLDEEICLFEEFEIVKEKSDV